MKKHFAYIATVAALIFSAEFSGVAAEKIKAEPPKNPTTVATNWADFVEPDFPFFSSVLDARNLGAGWPTNNLTPRGIILNLGNDCWACFDTDLLRVSAIWRGKGVTPVSMSQGSYKIAGAKAPEGQEKLPRMIGEPLLANGIYPGWQIGEKIALIDPREPAPDDNEVGRGPIDPKLGKFKAVRLTKNGVCLEYEVNGTSLREWIESRIESGEPVVQRRIRFDKVPKTLSLIFGRIGAKSDLGFSAEYSGAKSGVKRIQQSGLEIFQIQSSRKPVEISIALSSAKIVQTWKTDSKILNATSEIRWPEIVTTHGTLSTNRDAYVVDNIALPLENPWKRNVRLADLAFFRDGRAALVTFDGDVWTASGLEKNPTQNLDKLGERARLGRNQPAPSPVDNDAVKSTSEVAREARATAGEGARAPQLGKIVWKRFASGLHEPMGICVRDNELFVNDRNGIWRLRDTDGNGEADVHELFSNVFAQTAETREFASGLRVGPDGSFYISKGGQQGSTIGKLNGSVLKISPDGKKFEVLGWGLRQPFIGVHPKTGLVTASDQQGHYVPATPLHIIRDHRFYGFLSSLLPKEKYPAPIADPLTWIPHSINASGVSQVWLTDAKMGPLNDALIHIGYYRPELFLTLLNNRFSKPQAAVVSLTRDFQFAPLNGAVNPKDGQLYVTGFQIFGTTANQISGLARVRFTGEVSTLPREIVPMDQGVLVRFDVPLEKSKATNPANFSAERWNYQRTANYGSPHFKMDGSKGQDAMTPSSAYISRDGKSVFVGIPEMKPVMQMRLGWSLSTESGKPLQDNAYFTPYELAKFNSAREGFDKIQVDLTPKTVAKTTDAPINAAEGKRVAELMGCVACHSIDGSTLGKVGPTWKDLFQKERTFADGSKLIADENYIRQSIREPAAKVVAGFDKSDTGMPSYEGVISDAQIESIVLYIKSLSSR